MKVIVFEEKDALALLDQLKLGSFDTYGGRTAEIHNISEAGRKAFVEEIHRRFHYIVVRWLQDQGATCVR